MRHCVGAVAALATLIIIIVGPVYIVMSNSSSSQDESRCVGEIGCEPETLGRERLVEAERMPQ